MNKTFSFLILLSYLLMSPLAYSHHTNECLNQSLVNSVLSNLKLYSWEEINKSWKLMEQIDNCNDDGIVYKIVNALFQMQNLETENKNMKNPLSLVFKEGPLTFFKSRIQNIYFEPESQVYCPERILAYVSSNEKNSMHICQTMTNSNDSVLKTISTLLHEAHHINGSKHVICTQGIIFDRETIEESKKRFACDDDYESQGSYGLETSFQLDIFKTTKDPIQHQLARSNVISNLFTRFNNLPLNVKQGQIVASHKKGVQFYPYSNYFNSNLIQKTESSLSKTQAPLPRQKPKNPLMDSNQFFNIWGTNSTINAYAVNGHKLYMYSTTGNVYYYNHTNSLYYANDGLSEYYKTNLSSKEQASLVDVFYQTFDIDYGCLLFTNYMACNEKDTTKIHRINFSNIKPYGFYLLKDPESRHELIYLIDQSFKLYQIPNQFSAFEKFTERDLFLFTETEKNQENEFEKDHNFIVDPLHIFSLLKSNQDVSLIKKVLSLPNDKILQKIKSDSTWILGPFYYSPKLETL